MNVGMGRGWVKDELGSEIGRGWEEDKLERGWMIEVDLKRGRVGWICKGAPGSQATLPRGGQASGGSLPGAPRQPGEPARRVASGNGLDGLRWDGTGRGGTGWSGKGRVWGFYVT